jgi:hypothetical protein
MVDGVAKSPPFGVMAFLQDFAPGKRQICKNCLESVHMTKDGLERFSKDLRRYCQD